MIEIDESYYVSNKLVTKEKLSKEITLLKKQGKKIGLNSGNFDLLHAGHIVQLIEAKKLCDVLIVGLATDKLNRTKTKNKGRPVFSENIRAYILSKLKPVNFVVFNNDIQEIINLIKPDIYIKGIEYLKLEDEKMEDEKKLIEKLKGKVVYTNEVNHGNDKLSTKEIIKYIKEKT